LKKQEFDLCIDARMIESSGIGSYIQNVIKSFLGVDYKICVLIAPKKYEKFPFLKNFYCITCPFPIYSIKEQIFLPLYIPKCKIYWSPHFNIPLFPIRAKKRLVTIHDVYHLVFYYSLSWIKRTYASFLLKKACKKSDKIITISNFSRDELLFYQPFLDKEKIEIINPGVDSSLFKIPSKEEVNIVSKQYNLPQKYILHVGSIKPHKNIQRLLEAFLLLKDKSYKLVLVGQYSGLKTTFDLKEFLKKRPSLEERIIFLENVPTDLLPSLYNLATVTVSSSLYEGFGVTPIEAMGCGCSIAVSQVAALPEVCSSIPIYFNPYSIEDIAQKIDLLLENEGIRKEMIIQGRKYSEKYCYKKNISKYLELMDKLRK
jgi:glycosyltransferase involved in cell wall biosynthesis